MVDPPIKPDMSPRGLWIKERVFAICGLRATDVTEANARPFFAALRQAQAEWEKAHPVAGAPRSR